MAPAEPNALPFQQKGEAPVFAEERKGWGGYIEWEKYPEKKKQAEEVLANYDFPVVSTAHTPAEKKSLTRAGSHQSSSSLHCPRPTRS